MDALRHGATGTNLFEALMDSLAVGVVLENAAGNALACNSSAERILGLTLDQLAGDAPVDPGWTMIHEDGWPLTADDSPARVALRSGEPCMDVVLGVKQPDGRVTWVSVNAEPLFEGDGRPYAVAVSYVDITDARAAQEAERRSGDHFRSLIENSTDVITILDERGRQTYESPSVERVLGFTPGELDGAANRIGLVHHEDVGRVSEAIAGLIGRPGASVSFEYRLRARDGGWRTVESVATNRLHDPAVLGIVLNSRDLTELRAMTSQVARARDEAIRASQLKSEFLATTSHEIRTPMNAVIGTIELLLDTRLSPDQREMTTVIRDSAYGLLSILDDVLDISKIEAEKLEPKEVEFDLAAVVEAVADMVFSSARQKGLQLRAFVDPRAPSVLRGDAQWVRQVLANLASNAVKFSDEGEVSLRAEVEAETGEGVSVRFSVSDEGIGIPEAARERLFEPFAQLSDSEGGSGLGLAICRRLVRLMGGDIDVASEEGRGSTFAFALDFARAGGPSAQVPRRDLRVLLAGSSDGVVGEYLDAWGISCERAATPERARQLADSGEFDVAIVDQAAGALAASLQGRLGLVLLKDAPVKRQRLAEEISAAAGDTVRVPAGTRVLVAEDDAASRELLVRQLAKLGVTADAVASGADAVRAATGGTYDAILMDCQMPDVDGLEAARRIRTGERDGRRTPIVAVTGSPAALAAGMDAYVTKPLSAQDLAEVLTRILPAPEIDRAALAHLREEIGDADALERVVRLFVDGLRAVRAELHTAVERRDAAALGHVAHRLRSSSAMFGATRLADAAASLERLAASGLLDGAAEIVAEIERAAEVVRRELAPGHASSR